MTAQQLILAHRPHRGHKIQALLTKEELAAAKGLCNHRLQLDYAHKQDGTSHYWCFFNGEAQDELTWAALSRLSELRELCQTEN